MFDLLLIKLEFIKLWDGPWLKPANCHPCLIGTAKLGYNDSRGDWMEVYKYTGCSRIKTTSSNYIHFLTKLM